MASARMNPKTLQYIMGHSDIGVTLNTYTHLGFDDAQEEMARISKNGTAAKPHSDIAPFGEFSDSTARASNQ